MVEVGLFRDERIELLQGVLVEMSPQGAKHSATVQRLNKVLLRALDPRAEVRIQSPFAAMDDSEPEPDVAIVAPGDYDEAHPCEAWLIVEVADSSLAKDRGLKAGLYAASSVPEYWIVNLEDRAIEVHWDIIGGRYARVAPFRLGESIALQAFPDVQIEVSDILR
jgi:Uma2 family endonuclease